MNPSDALSRLQALLGAKNLIADPKAMAPWLEDPYGKWQSRALAVARPQDTQQTAQVIKLAAACGLRIVPQSGNTGLTGGQIADDPTRDIILSTQRMQAIRRLDPEDNAAVVEAGVILDDLHAAAASVDRRFPLTLGARGSCRVGGLIATNAGGVHVLRHGMMGALTLGLEVALANGQVWSNLKTLRKDNAGLDLKQLFIGAEGAFGVITAAALKLVARPSTEGRAFIAVRSPQDAVAVLRALESHLGDAVEAFELISRPALDLTLKGIPGLRRPLEDHAPWYVLAEIVGHASQADDAARLEQAFADLLERGLIQDCVIAANQAQADAFWKIREEIPSALKRNPRSVWRCDIATPVSAVPTFLERAGKAVHAIAPQALPLPFGHLGDGSMHYNLLAPEGLTSEHADALGAKVIAAIHDIADDLDGSISAEHGIGRLRVDELSRRASPVAIDLMRALKATLDPHGLFNPGKTIPNDLSPQR